MAQLEGKGLRQLYELMRGDTTQPTTLTTGVIKSPLPEISLRIDGETIDTPSQGIVVAEHLTEHKRIMSFTGGTISGNVSVPNSAGTLTSLTTTDVNVTIKSNLNVDDKVIVAVANDGQLVYILDKAVI